MRKKAAALVLCVLLAFQMAGPPVAEAADYVYFVAAGDNILPLSDATMPFWHNGYLYVASSIFNSSTRDALDILSFPINDTNGTLLYSIGQNRALRFDLDKYYAYDEKNDTYFPGAVSRNGEIYVPISVVARFFGLQYTVTKVNSVVNGETVQGDLAWIRRSDTSLADKNFTVEDFVDAASFSIANLYIEYLKGKEQQNTPVEDTTTVPEDVVDIEGKRIYLCMTAGENTAELLDVLDRYKAQAAFFCTPEFLTKESNLLRRMTATGQAVGILVDAGDEEWTVVEQLEAGNRALELATCGKTRLAMVQNGDGQALQAVRDAGYRCLKADLNRSGYDLKSAANANSLLQRVLARRGDDVTVWLAGKADPAGLRKFLITAGNSDCRCLAWTETT